MAPGIAQSWEHAMGARVAMALGAASVMPTASVIATSLVPAAQRTAALSLVFGGLTASVVVALPISSAVAEAAGWRATWFVTGGAAFVAALGVLVGIPGDATGERSSFVVLSDARRAF